MHDFIKIMSEDDVCEYNLLFFNDANIRKSVNSASSAYMYYETKEEQICSIFNNIMCFHYFADSNKRIPVIILISYAYQAI